MIFPGTTGFGLPGSDATTWIGQTLVAEKYNNGGGGGVVKYAATTYTPCVISGGEAGVFVTDLVTAALLFAQYSISRSRSLLALATGYLFTAFIVVPHALTVAGAFTPAGLLGAGIQTGSWLFIFWHIGYAAGLLAYAGLRGPHLSRTCTDVTRSRLLGYRFGTDVTRGRVRLEARGTCGKRGQRRVIAWGPSVTAPITQVGSLMIRRMSATSSAATITTMPMPMLSVRSSSSSSTPVATSRTSWKSGGSGHEP